MDEDFFSALTELLEKTTLPDNPELEAAQTYLEQAAQTNLPEFVKTLSEILECSWISPVVRMAAGLQLKNTLTSKDPDVKKQYQQCWLAFPEETRAYVKKNILASLGTENNRPSSAAQCVAYVAVAELPVGQCIGVMVNNVIDSTSTEMKEATHQAMGYICEDIVSCIY
ncbi:importin subunit beta-like [Zootermopsis nevadensis]|uniref:Importin subunit beta n=1 Tax=Zootermopsis nevadensis TaxID=136037 RepID=A0A067QHF1_ZOONE|nr:importin subunit beta-like [Zootermopsis nevadensis]KDR02409.1 Importin subunit beta [Zootermopsis nevadensis]